MRSSTRHGGGRTAVPRRRSAAIIALCVVLALALSGCAPGALDGLFRSHGGSDTSESGSTGIHSNRGDSTDGGVTIASLRPKHSSAVERYYAQTVHWTPCHRTLRCGFVRVPIDWQHVGTASIRLALVMHHAAGTAVGDLLVNPGGPGGSGVGFVEGGVEGVVDGAVASRFNVVGFDPRGVGDSSPVTCYDDAQTDVYNYGIDPGGVGSATWIAAERQKSSDLLRACVRHTGPVLGHIDSVNAATDMDVIRSALGQSKLDFLGYSYGTYLGTLYAGLFPKRVGRFVLDGADDPWGSGYVPSDSSDTADDSADYSVAPSEDGTVGQAVGFEKSLRSYLGNCVAEKHDAVGGRACPFAGAEDKAESQVAALFTKVNAHPFVAKDGRQLGGATLATAIDDAMYDPSDWPYLTRMFIQLKTGITSQAFEFADEYNDRNSDGSYADNNDFANLAIGCVEGGSDVDLKYDRREATELRKVAPLLGIYSAYGDLVCSGWKGYGPSPFPNPVHALGSGPIIVVGTTGDPATPYSDAQLLSRQLDNGHLVTYHGEGHTAYDRGDDCIDATIDAYLLRGTVPASDPQCH